MAALQALLHAFGGTPGPSTCSVVAGLELGRAAAAARGFARWRLGYVGGFPCRRGRARAAPFAGNGPGRAFPSPRSPALHAKVGFAQAGVGGNLSHRPLVPHLTLGDDVGTVGDGASKIEVLL